MCFYVEFCRLSDAFNVLEIVQPGPLPGLLVLLQPVYVWLPVFVPVAHLEGLPCQLLEVGDIFILPGLQWFFFLHFAGLKTLKWFRMPFAEPRLLTLVRPSRQFPELENGSLVYI